MKLSQLIDCLAGIWIVMMATGLVCQDGFHPVLAIGWVIAILLWGKVWAETEASEESDNE